MNHGLYKTVLTINTQPALESHLKLPVQVTVIDTIPPAPITDLTAVATAADSLLTQWTAPGDNAYSGRVDKYEVWLLTTPDFENEPVNGVRLQELQPSGNAGEKESVWLNIGD